MSLLIAALVGAFAWTLTEYLLHRFRGHAATGRSPFKREHLSHHAQVDYFSPIKTKVWTAIPPVLGLAAVSTLLLGPATGSALTLGFVSAYVGYEICHWRLHVFPPTGPWSRFLRRHHFAHHFDDARLNHGVTSALWDRVFGTYALPEVLDVPEDRAPRWLRGEEARSLPAPLSEDYRLISRSPSRTARRP
ncbi:MAG: sterol desaturase family protein [Myxococcota bacterium]|nr:sterol desaturase family protein [Myxococcota bacterium]